MYLYLFLCYGLIANYKRKNVALKATFACFIRFYLLLCLEDSLHPVIYTMISRYSLIMSYRAYVPAEVFFKLAMKVP